MVTWTKLPALEKPGFKSGCLNCGPNPVTCDLQTELAVGFGSCTVTKDGEGIYDENMIRRGDDYPRLKKYEKLAAADPDHDWRVAFYAALAEREYQRHGDGLWVLIRTGEGFA